ncbi:T9SS type A sorting domain-containing protein, partial [bacterium]|nr:T9SS type A sorting domain-containing protein [bacterium]
QVEVALTPYGMPIQIPATGGSFDFNIEIFNLEDTPVVLDAWISTVTPTGYEYVLLGPVNLMLPGGSSISRERTQLVPENAPPGNYVYYAYIGQYPDVVWDDNFFQFEKLSSGFGPAIGEWFNIGEPLDKSESLKLKAENYELISAYPNPFNPTTVLSYELRVTSSVLLNVFDIQGRKVAELVDGYRDAGLHEVTFDGANLASGIYLYRLTAGEFTGLGKMVLIK